MDFAWWVPIPLLAIVGWIVIAVAQVIGRTRVRELEIRERIAMIEKGLVPPPEVDPDGFERRLGRIREFQSFRERRGYGPGRIRRVGIILIGVGTGLVLLIGFTDDLRSGIGVGGFLIILGLAFLVSAMFDGSHQSHVPSTSMPPPPASSPSEPPRPS